MGTAHQSRLCHSERSEESHPRHCEESAVRRTTCQSLFNLLNSKFSILHSKFLLLLCTCALVLFNIATPAYAQYGGGTGEPNDPYLIFDANQMNAIGADSNDWDKHFKLMADIDLSGYSGTAFNIIGTRYNPFTGVFDGNGFEILNFDSTGAVFGVVNGANAEIKNLGLRDPNILGASPLVGSLWHGTITNCYVEGGIVTGGSGLVGHNVGTITNCYSMGTVSGTRYVGGLVGLNGYWFDLSFYPGTISNCYSTGSVSGNDKVGGLVGWSELGMISNCYSTGSVTGTTNVGGLVGSNYARITNCYSEGHVSGDERVGGLVGYNLWGTITNCYSNGTVAGSERIGGLVGYNFHQGTITKCYSSGSVLGSGNNVGGLVGDNWYTGEVTDSFWDIETSGQSSSAGGSGRTTAQMKTASTYLGWNGCGEIIWTIDEGNDYPRFLWEDRPGQPLPEHQLGDFLQGSGSEIDPYLVYTAEQLNMIGLFLCEWDKHFKLMADIDLSGFTGDEFNISGPWYIPFSGVFDGNGHAISNFSSNTGLFRYVRGSDAEIKNLGLIEPNVDAGTSDCVGSLVANLENGAISNCYVEGGSVAGDWYVGCLVGWNSGTITNCYSTGSVSGEKYVGGLVGRNSGTITNCYASGSVIGNRDVGGLAGLNYSGTITNCYSTGTVTGTGLYVGGLVGDNRYGTITNAFWDTQTSGQPTSAGGTGLPTAEMQMQVTFMDAGWDFVGERINGSEDIWMMTCEGMSYPKLNWWQPVLGDYFCPDGVDMIDMEHLALHWLDTGCDETNDYCDWAEISNDSTIDFTDFAILADNWLAGF